MPASPCARRGIASKATRRTSRAGSSPRRAKRFAPRSTRACSDSPRRRSSAIFASWTAATCRTAPSSCSTTRPATCSPTSDRAATCRARPRSTAVARRQAGSTLKPFLYSLAIERRLLTAASILDDSPLAITTAAGLYVPQNYDHDFKGPVSCAARSPPRSTCRRCARWSSSAIELSFERFATSASTLDRDAEHYGYGLALGGGEVTLLDLTNAYRALANGGRYAPVRFSAAGRSDAVQVIDERAAFIVTDILADRQRARAPSALRARSPRPITRA